MNCPSKDSDYQIITFFCLSRIRDFLIEMSGLVFKIVLNQSNQKNPMKTLKKIFSVLVVVIFLSSCSLGTMPVGATSNTVGSKVGTASSTYVLGLVALSEGGVAEAARQGGITKISTVDVKATMFGYIWTKVTTTVTGE